MIAQQATIARLAGLAHQIKSMEVRSKSVMQAFIALQAQLIRYHAQFIHITRTDCNHSAGYALKDFNARTRNERT
jgi:hypothetical protein